MPNLYLSETPERILSLTVNFSHMLLISFKNVFFTTAKLELKKTIRLIMFQLVMEQKLVSSDSYKMLKFQFMILLRKNSAESKLLFHSHHQERDQLLQLDTQIKKVL